MPILEDGYIRAEVSKHLGKDVVKFIEHASALGWQVVATKDGTAVTLVPYGDFDAPSRRIHLRQNGRNNAAFLQKKHRQLVRWSIIQQYRKDGLLPDGYESISDAEIARGMQDGTFSAEFLQELGQRTLASDGLKVVKDEPKRERHQRVDAPVTFTTSGRTMPTPAEVAERQKAARHIVSERPAIMHAGLKKGYPSDTTIERRWSDGTVDYACAAPNCGETSMNRRAFGNAHWAMHLRRGEVEKARQRGYVEDPSHTEVRDYTPANYRLRKLQALLNGIDLTKITAEDLAEQIDASLRREDQDEHGEPLTAEQMIDRIRRMIDRGHYMEQEDKILALSRQLDEVTEYADEQIAQAEAKATEAVLRANALEETLTTLHDMLGDLVPKGATG